jgi:hypothetical protein
MSDKLNLNDEKKTANVQPPKTEQRNDEHVVVNVQPPKPKEEPKLTETKLGKESNKQ